MNLLFIARKIWRYRLATLPVLAFVLIGAFYVIAIKDPVYEASATSNLLNPPPPPTEDQITRNPALGEIDADNPYTRYSDQSVVVQVVAARLSSDAAREELVQKGADPDYTVAPSAEFGFTAPIVEITGTGSNPEAAVETANLVGAAFTRELDRMQEARGVASDYRITTNQVVVPLDAELKASGQLRPLVGLLAFGVIMLFVVVSGADALEALRRERAQDHMDGAAGAIRTGAVLLEPVPMPGPGPAERVLVRGSAEERPSRRDDRSAPGSNGDSTRRRGWSTGSPDPDPEVTAGKVAGRGRIPFAPDR